MGSGRVSAGNVPKKKKKLRFLIRTHQFEQSFLFPLTGDISGDLDINFNGNRIQCINMVSLPVTEKWKTSPQALLKCLGVSKSTQSPGCCSENVFATVG